MRAGTLQISGGCLETGWWGPGPAEAPTLVLLHEGLGSVALWRDVPSHLAAATGWGVFAYSRFGYGNSYTTPLPRPMTYMHHEAHVVLPEVLRGAGIRHAVLIGHSDGGSIAAIYAGTQVSSFPAMSRPSEREGLSDCCAITDSWPRTHPRPTVMVGEGRPSTACGPELPASVDGRPSPTMTALRDGASTAAGHDGITLLGLVTIAAHFFVEDLNIASIRQIAVTYDTGDLRQRLARYHRDVDVAFRGWNDAWLDPRFHAFDITGFLPTIQAPILALQGADDPYGTDDQLKVFAANVRAPIETRLIPGAKHSPHLEAKDVTLAAISDFIADLKRGFPT